MKNNEESLTFFSSEVGCEIMFSAHLTVPLNLIQPTHLKLAD